MNLTTKVLLALALGVLAGLALNTSDLTNNSFADAYLIDGLFTVVGLLFLNSLKMITEHVNRRGKVSLNTSRCFTMFDESC